MGKTTLPVPTIQSYDVMANGETRVALKCPSFRGKPGQNIGTETRKGTLSVSYRDISVLPADLLPAMKELFDGVNSLVSSKLATTEQNAVLGVRCKGQEEAIGSVACLACCNDMCSRSSSPN